MLMLISILNIIFSWILVFKNSFFLELFVSFFIFSLFISLYFLIKINKKEKIWNKIGLFILKWLSCIHLIIFFYIIRNIVFLNLFWKELFLIIVQYLLIPFWIIIYFLIKELQEKNIKKIIDIGMKKLLYLNLFLIISSFWIFFFDITAWSVELLLFFVFYLIPSLIISFIYMIYKKILKN